MKARKARISAKKLEEKFDEGKEDILEYFDTKSATRRILVDFPEWMILALDREAKHLGISRQAIIKFWINEKLRETPHLRKVSG